jgi:hypothetical protein
MHRGSSCAINKTKTPPKKKSPECGTFNESNGVFAKASAKSKRDWSRGMREPMTRGAKLGGKKSWLK